LARSDAKAARDGRRAVGTGGVALSGQLCFVHMYVHE